MKQTCEIQQVSQEQVQQQQPHGYHQPGKHNVISERQQRILCEPLDQVQIENVKSKSYKRSYYSSMLNNTHDKNKRSVLLMTSPTSDEGTSSRGTEAAKQLFCGGMAGAVGKTITAPFSRLTILFQVHSMVTTKEHRPKFAMSISSGISKIIDRGGLVSLWKGNLTSVLHRFPYSAINFFMYEATLDLLHDPHEDQDDVETEVQLVRRITHNVDQVVEAEQTLVRKMTQRRKTGSDTTSPNTDNNGGSSWENNTKAGHKFLAGAVAGSTACIACYPLDLVRTRLTTQLEGQEHYRGILDSIRKIYVGEGFLGFFSGIGPTLLVAVPNFAISYTVYGTLKEYTLDDELFYNLRRIDADSGEAKMGMLLTVMCGAASGTLATCITFPMDTIRRRMQIQSLHTPNPRLRLSSYQLFHRLIHQEGLKSLYRGLTPEILKVMPMVGSMFLVYEFTKEKLKV